MIEEWREIIETNGHYSASNLGRIRSNKREVEHKLIYKVSVQERILKPSKDGCGYLRVSIVINKKLKTRKVHRLIATSFIGGNNLDVNHINGIKTDNRLCNLEFCTRSENVIHAFKIGLATGLKGIKNPTCKTSEETVVKIKTMLRDRITIVKISKITNTSIHIIKDISRGKTWNHIVLS